MNNLAFRQRALGAIIGSAVGDALGARFEFGPAGAYSKQFPEPFVGGIGEMIGGGHFHWEPGEFTDDTQMGIVQAESILACGGIDGSDLFSRFKLWADGAKDVGTQTSAVLRSQLDWNEAALEYFRRNPNNSAGNGSLMRATPTAVHFAHASEAESIEAAHQASLVTHGDPAAGWGTALFHVMIRAALHGDDPFAALDSSLKALPPEQHRYVEMLDAGWQPSQAKLRNVTVWTCLAQAVWAVRTHRTSFAEAVTTAIDLGGDTDTVAAVTGGLAGALQGIQNIPSRWTTYVHGRLTTPQGRRIYRAWDLQLLTARILGDGAASDTELGPRQGPTEISPGLFAADLGAAGHVAKDSAVMSLCRVGDRFADHPVRREVYLIDNDENHNLALASVVDDTVKTIDAWLSEGRTVVVHCHGGASRTGLVLRAWLMRKYKWPETEATSFLKKRWPVLGEWNDSFTAFLRERWR
jgi:ADP-ribosyl-[dinitrogen reductase] hydrolase